MSIVAENSCGQFAAGSVRVRAIDCAGGIPGSIPVVAEDNPVSLIDPINRVSTYPNSADSELNIDLSTVYQPGVSVQIKLYDVTGRIAFEGEGDSRLEIVNTIGLKEGIYNLVISSSSDQFTQKVVIKH